MNIIFSLKPTNNRRDTLNIFVLSLPVLIAVFLTIFAPGFASTENLLNLIPQATPLLILSLGLMFPVLTGGIDISNGALVSVLAAILISFGTTVGILLALAVAMATGLANGVGVSRFKVHPIVMTLGIMIIFNGLTPLILPNAASQVETVLAPLARGRIMGVPLALIWCVLALVAIWIILTKTRLGTQIYATGANEKAVWLSGIQGNKIIIICYMISSLTALLAAMFIVGRIGSSTVNIGDPLILNSITAVAIGGVLLSGGIGSVWGVLCGVATLTFINNGMNYLSVDPFMQRVVTGTILLVAIGFQKRKEIGV